jgi:hypothetical protein
MSGQAASPSAGTVSHHRGVIDDDVPAFRRALGLPGLADVHTHFLPARMQRRVWAHFDPAGPLIGRPRLLAQRRRAVRPAGIARVDIRLIVAGA